MTKPKCSKSGFSLNEKSFKKREFNFTEKQVAILEKMFDPESKIVFLSGSAGTSKSYMAVYAALHLLKENPDKKILYLRSVIESASKSLGALPGPEGDKFFPYMVPVLDKIEEIVNDEPAKILLSNEIVTAAPINFLRGASWRDKIVIADECFTGKTKVVLESGNKMITFKNLLKIQEKGEQLPKCLSFNETTKQFEPKQIVRVIERGIKPIIEARFGNKKIHCTDNHRFLTNDGWKMVKDLSIGEGVLCSFLRHQVLATPNSDQKQMILGSWLGDGGIHEVNSRQRLKVIHGIKQEEYCLWKSAILNGNIEYIEKNGYAQKPAIRFSTKMFPKITPNNKKSICAEDLKDLDWRGIAIWIMNDGSRSTNMLNIFTCSFDDTSHQVFVDKFKELGVDCSIRKHKEKYNMLVFNTENAAKVFKNIAPYCHKTMAYKVGDSAELGSYNWNNKFLTPTVSFDCIKDINKSEEVYDIEVEDNHNFLVYGGNNTRTTVRGDGQISGLVAHNCQNMTRKELTTILTRVGEGTKVFVLGDPSQSDINGQSGFAAFFKAFTSARCEDRGIYSFEFGKEDIVRSEILKFIVERIEGIESPKH